MGIGSCYDWKNPEQRGRLLRRIFIVVTLGSFLLWTVGCVLGGKESRQFTLFFADCENFMADMLNVVGYSSQRNVYANVMYIGLGERAYPPLPYMLMYFFSRLVDMQPYYDRNQFFLMYTEQEFLIMFIIILIILLLALFELFRSNALASPMEKRLLAVSLLLSAPMLFSIERGNTIIPTVFFLGFYIFYYRSENRVIRELALMSLAVAAAFKITPALFGILLIYRKSWSDAVHAVIYGLLFFFLPFLFFKGGFSNIPLMIQNVQENLRAYDSSDGCTIYAAILRYYPVPSQALHIITTWVTRIVCLALLVAAPLLKREWEKILVVSLVLIILPSHSGYYNILYILPAIVLFLSAKEHDCLSWIILFGFICICFDLKWAGEVVMNYHVALIALLVVLVVKCVSGVICSARRESAETGRT